MSFILVVTCVGMFNASCVIYIAVLYNWEKFQLVHIDISELQVAQKNLKVVPVVRTLESVGQPFRKTLC